MLMRVLSYLVLPAIILVITAFAWVLFQSAENTRTVMVSDVALSPWDALTGAEITRAAAAVKARHGDDVIITRISLRQPEKAVALAWQQGQVPAREAEMTFRHAGQSFVTNFDLNANTLAPSTIIRGGQPMLSPQGELFPVVEKINANEELVSILAARGVAEGEGLCLPRTIGRFFADKVDVRNARIVRLDCFNIASTGGLGILPTTNAFARPIEGISILYDIDREAIVEITDSYADGNFPPHDVSADEYHNGALETRAPVKPVVTSRPQGQNFSIRGGQIDWQGWQFWLRFDPRQGTVLNRVGHRTPDGLRSVAYEIAMSEMFVPYHDNNAHWFYRAYYDMGEFGFGNMATPLKGADCPAHAVFQDVTLYLPDGAPYKAARRVCIFEHDPGYPAWRHYESLYEGVPGMDIHQSRRATELVVRMVATIGNYDYFQDYVFRQDGQLRIRLISTGVDAVKAVFSQTLADARAAEETQTGTLVAPNRLAVNHDHFFSYRIDMDVDGRANNFSRQKLRAVRQPEGAPRSGIWGLQTERVTTESQAQTKMDARQPALLVFSSADKNNAMGYPSAYQIMMPNIDPLVPALDAAFQRAYFVRNNLWVTRYKRPEIFAAGMQTNQSASWLGLPEYIFDNENLENEDLVAWVTVGFHHVPMAEDWPVMPSKVDEIILKPRNYFDRNPAIDLPN
jgi:primary-amine oxidase